ncbi:4'-phosphopantetheinyl transferase family protein [Luteimonas sp. JM171]|uniref:4'-phosphopantetheinyl transferase family protein n=1 Tax=Luteimonas sp. JM171 TaxID=1896164 RepID=UPI00085768A8|nr:4'-phosphopantetheinyl transferase superfamily protein [Luteimonas sp. JM171]AOH35956.1 hypothetical protein BGP89_05920 [Luteimonas sp. JM171]
MHLSAGHLEFDRVRCAWQPYRRGEPAEPQVRKWLESELGIRADDLALERDRHGRPRLGPAHPGLDANWSHSGNGLLMALGTGVRIGCDLELARPRPRALELARRYFTLGEAEWLAGLSGTARETVFVRIWCAKEAMLKAHGRGLAFGLHRLEFAERDGALALVDCDPELGEPADWSLYAFEPAAGYLATFAWYPLRPGLQEGAGALLQ